MRKSMWQIEEKGTTLGMSNEIRCVLCIAGRQSFEVDRLLNYFSIVNQHAGRHVVAVGNSKVLIEAATGGHVFLGPSQVPFAHTGGLVTTRFQKIGKCYFIKI